VPGVSEADVGDHADRGARDFGQRGDVAGEAGAHLGHDDLGPVGCAEERERDPGLVVERARAGVRSSAGCQRGEGEILGGGLPGGAGDTDDRDRSQAVAGMTAEGGERGEAVGDLDDRGAARWWGDWLADERDGRVARPGISDEVVPVAGRDEGHEAPV
jgi:hypothetical protein